MKVKKVFLAETELGVKPIYQTMEDKFFTTTHIVGVLVEITEAEATKLISEIEDIILQ